MAIVSAQSIPTREILTDWGPMYVTCTEPDVLHFSTNRTVAGGESHLTINRVAYSCTVDLHRTVSGIDPNHYSLVDEVWRVSKRQQWGALRRLPQWGEATYGARRVLSDGIIPTLAKVAPSGEMAALLDEGDKHWRAHLRDAADVAERTLVAAKQRVRAIRSELDAGRRISGDDEKFLRRLRVEDD